MISSMTSFARSEHSSEWGSLVWEIRSLNHRYLEVSIRLPEDLRPLENLVREKVKKQLKRGKIECNLRFRPNERNTAHIELNTPLANALAKACAQIAQSLADPGKVNPADLLKFPGVILDADVDRQPIMEQAMNGFNNALDQLIEGRRKEGAAIKTMIETRTQSIAQLTAKGREVMPEVMQRMRDKFRQRLVELAVEADPNRIEQELAIMVQKLDIDEELDRLENHVTEVENNLKKHEPVGRRLDFLMQELNREANTLGSKSSDTQMTNISVELKVLIEQMREQIQNIE